MLVGAAENQFFLSSAEPDTKEGPANKIALAIVNRLKKAISTGTVFRVIIVVPEFPEGSYHDDVTVRYIMFWQYRTIHVGSGSILGQLRAAFPDVNLDDYIAFHALRRAERLGSTIVSGTVYVHSKLLLVDDRIAIVGSANINDRSMNGSPASALTARAQWHPCDAAAHGLFVALGRQSRFRGSRRRTGCPIRGIPDERQTVPCSSAARPPYVACVPLTPAIVPAHPCATSGGTLRTKSTSAPMARTSWTGPAIGRRIVRRHRGSRPRVRL